MKRSQDEREENSGGNKVKKTSHVGRRGILGGQAPGYLHEMVALCNRALKLLYAVHNRGCRTLLFNVLDFDVNIPILLASWGACSATSAAVVERCSLGIHRRESEFVDHERYVNDIA